jgi:hypothetical protein
VDPVGVEPPLGHAIDAHEPVGEVGEVQASIEELGDAVVVAAPPLAGAKATDSVDDPSHSGGTEAPTAVRFLPAEVSPRPTPQHPNAGEVCNEQNHCGE